MKILFYVSGNSPMFIIILGKSRKNTEKMGPRNLMLNNVFGFMFLGDALDNFWGDFSVIFW